jgi:hypothetical protein
MNLQQEKALYVLDQMYENVRSAKSFNDFMIFSKDYVQYIQQSPEFIEIIRNYEDTKEKLLIELEETEKFALKDLDVAEKYILKFVKDEPSKEEEMSPISGGLSGLRAYKNNTLQMSGLKSINIERFLIEIIRKQSQEIQQKIAKKFTKTINGRTIFQISSNVDKLKELVTNYESKMNEEIWGCWNFLKLIPRIIPYLHSNDMTPFYSEKFSYLDQPTMSKFVHLLHSTYSKIASKESDLLEYRNYIARLNPNIHHTMLHTTPVTLISDQNKDSEFQTSVSKTFPRMLTKDVNGDYWFRGNKLSISKNTMYFDAFNALFTSANQNGFLSYADMEKELVALNHPPCADSVSRNSRINNLIHNNNQGLFRHSKINGKRFKNELPDRSELISIERGDGLKLNNPVETSIR